MVAAKEQGDHDLSERGEAIGHMLSMMVRVLRVPASSVDVPKKRVPVRVFLSDEDSQILDSLSGYFGVSDSQVVWLAMMLELSALGHYQKAQGIVSGEGGAG